MTGWSDSPAPTELLRKAVHLSFGGVALTLRWLTPWQAAGCAALALAFNVFLLHRLTGGRLLREAERPRGFSWGVVLYPTAVLVLVVVFRRRLELAAAVWGLLAFGDGMATVAGTLLGGPRLRWNPRKTWAGFAAFVLYGTVAAALLLRWTQRSVLDPATLAGDAAVRVGSSFLARSLADAVVADPAYLLLGCCAAALAAALAESADSGVDDNVLVPLVGGAVLWAATLVEPGRLIAAGPDVAARLTWAAPVNAAAALAALALRAVDRSGALWGAVLGTALSALSGWGGFVVLVLFVVLGSGATRLGYERKAALGLAQERGGRRGARHAFANVTTGVACAFLVVATPFSAAALVGVVAAFATATCDTVSSEVGQAYGRRHYRITDLRRVAPGSEGAVSLVGSLSGIGAAALVAWVGWAAGMIGAAGVAIVVLAACIGATAESYAAAAIGPRGRPSNELLNFGNTVVGATVAVALFVFLGSPR